MTALVDRGTRDVADEEAPLGDAPEGCRRLDERAEGWTTVLLRPAS